MTSDIMGELGELRAEVRALRFEHNRHVDRADATYHTVVQIQLELAENRGHLGSAVRHAITAGIAASAGLLGGYLSHIWGAH